jgi:carbon-monoxide dehydrogenase medium subunit
VATKAYRAKAVEAELEGKRLDAALIRRAAQSAPDKVDALADLHASSEYRAHLATVYTRRAVEAALSRAG